MTRLAFALACFACFLLLRHWLRHREALARACRALLRVLGNLWAWLVTTPEREPITPQQVTAHPAVRKRRPLAPPLEHDGEPLTGEEKRILAEVEMDAMISIPEPRDGSDR